MSLRSVFLYSNFKNQSPNTDPPEGEKTKKDQSRKREMTKARNKAILDFVFFNFRVFVINKFFN